MNLELNTRYLGQTVKKLKGKSGKWDYYIIYNFQAASTTEMIRKPKQQLIRIVLKISNSGNQQRNGQDSKTWKKAVLLKALREIKTNILQISEYLRNLQRMRQ